MLAAKPVGQAKLQLLISEFFQSACDDFVLDRAN